MNVRHILLRTAAAAALSILLAGASLAQTPCQQIAATITELQAEVADLQQQLQGAGPSEKPAIIAQIKKLNSEIAAQKNDLSKCGSLSGGEAFPMQGGVLVSAADVAQSIITCP